MEEKPINWFKPVSQLRKGVSLPGLRRVFGANFFYFAGFAFFTTFIPVFLVKRFGFAQFQTGNFFLYIGILTIIGQTIIVPRVYARFEEARVVPLTLFLTGLAIVVLPLPDSLVVFLLLVPVFSFSNALTQVGLNTVVSNRADDRDQGLALGTNQSLRALGNAIPSMLSGVAAAVATASAPLFIAGTIMMLTAIVYHAVETRV
jgi:predicted MFS family arabinose efflux permease